jgi:SAM-dependent methyltransferase
VSVAKAIYHRFIPESVRNPFGRARRSVADRLTRVLRRSPLPPAALLLNVQMTPYVDEFIRIGRRSAESIEGAITPLLEGSSAPTVLDFGCGCGRTLLHVPREWDVHGCDIDHAAIAWLRHAIDASRFRVNDPSPPLPWPDDTFDAAYAVSVFTHFSETQHQSWRVELSRVLRPGAILAVSSMGPGILSNFPAHATDGNRSVLRERGYFFVPASTCFNANAAFHTPAGLARLLAPEFVLLATSEQGLDGFQDLSLFRKS